MQLKAYSRNREQFAEPGYRKFFLGKAMSSFIHLVKEESTDDFLEINHKAKGTFFPAL